MATLYVCHIVVVHTRAAGRDDVGEHLAGTDRRKLGDVANDRKGDLVWHGGRDFVRCSQKQRQGEVHSPYVLFGGV